MNTCKLIPAFLGMLLSLNTVAKNNESSPVVPQTPFVFLENKGQITDQDKIPRKDIDFKLNSGALNVFFGKGQLHYQWSKTVTSSLGIEDAKAPVETYRMDVILDGANKDAAVVAENKQEYLERYYTATCNGAISNSYTKVTYKDIYPKIDWVLYVKDGHMEYDFVVHPGGNPADIKLRYEGATAMAIENGMLRSSTPHGFVTEQKPYSYYADSKQTVASSFKLDENVLSINIAADNKHTVVIDPILNWGTYFGITPNSTRGNAVVADAAGNGYLAGTTNININLATNGVHQSFLGGGNDAYIVKFTAAGGVGSRVWCTYYGGTGDEDGAALTYSADSAFLYLTGTTQSTNAIAYSTSFGTAHQSAYSGGGGNPPDAFLAKFNTSDGTIRWATYYGGTASDYGTSVTCDLTGNVYLGGRTGSSGLQSSSGVFQSSLSGFGSFFVKFNAGGVRQFASYYNNVDINAVTCDTAGNFYVAGNTSCASSCNIAQSGHQNSYGGGTSDAFLSKFTSGGSRIWGTYYGGSGFESVVCVNTDVWGNVYISGQTGSANTSNVIATTGTHLTTSTGTTDGFLVKFNTAGIRQWGTYYGGSGIDNIVKVFATPDGRIYASGHTYSSSGIATTNGIKTTYQGPPVITTPVPSNPNFGDAFVARFGKFGNRLYGTYYGDTLEDEVTTMAYAAGKLYFGGNTSSPSGIAPKNVSYLDTSFVWPTAYLVQFQGDTNVYINKAVYTDTQLCMGASGTLPYNVTNTFRTGNVFTLQISSDGFVNSYNIGSTTATGGGNINYSIPTSGIPAAANYRARIISTLPADTTYDNAKDIRLSQYPTPFAGANTPICAGEKLHLFDAGSSPGSTVFTWRTPSGFTTNFVTYDINNVQFADSGYYLLTADNYGCIKKDSVKVSVKYAPAKPTVVGNGPVCTGDTLRVIASSTDAGVEWNWIKPQPPYYYFNVGGDTTIPSASLADSGKYKVFTTLNGCLSAADSVNVTVIQSVIPTVGMGVAPGNAVNPGTQITFTANNITNAGTAPVYKWMKNGFYISGANNSTYLATMGVDIQDSDTICVEMTSNAVCPRPVTVKSCTPVYSVGIKNVLNKNGLKLYPNPNTGKFTVEGKVHPGKEVKLEIVNALGQVVYRDNVIPVANSFKKELNLDKEFVNGVYVLRLQGEGENGTLRFTLNR